jgi:flagellar protein FlaG
MNVVESNTNVNVTKLSREVVSAEQASASSETIAHDKVNQTSAIEQANAVKSEPLTAQQLEKVAQQLQQFVGEMNRGLEFSVDTDSGRDVIKVIDKNSGDLVKQYPSEEVLSLVANLSDMVGGFVDAKV